MYIYIAQKMCDVCGGLPGAVVAIQSEEGQVFSNLSLLFRVLVTN